MKTYIFFVGLEQLHKIEIACAIHFWSMKRHLSFAYSDREKTGCCNFAYLTRVVYTIKTPFLVLFVTGYGYPVNRPEVNYSPLVKKNLGKFYYNYSSGK